MKPIKDILAAHGVPIDDSNDATLSGSEHAQAIIITALVEQWDRLDGRQQRSIVDALEASTVMTEEAEGWVRIGFAPFSGIDVGLNRGGPVHWGLHEEHGPFAYSGQLESVRYIPGDKAPYDPEVLATLERDTESAGD